MTERKPLLDMLTDAIANAKEKPPIPAELDDSDWQCAFEYAGIEDADGHRYGTPNVSAQKGWVGDTSGFTRADVVEVIAKSDGENDERSWLGFFRLRDGRYAFLTASCDYTGWDCQASGYAIVGGIAVDMIRFAMGREDRERLGLSLEPPA